MILAGLISVIEWIRDFPNGWAPIHHMIVEGLVKSGSLDAREMAEDISIRWIRTNYAAYEQTGKMHEKYNVVSCGDFGGGGEYVPQVGPTEPYPTKLPTLENLRSFLFYCFLLVCRLVLAGRMELCWLSWMSLAGLKTGK